MSVHLRQVLQRYLPHVVFLLFGFFLVRMISVGQSSGHFWLLFSLISLIGFVSGFIDSSLYGVAYSASLFGGILYAILDFKASSSFDSDVGFMLSSLMIWMLFLTPCLVFGWIAVQVRKQIVGRGQK